MMKKYVLFTFLLVSFPAAAQEVEREELAVVGWNDACSLALTHFGYPRLGEAAQAEPVMTRIGTISIAPGEQVSKLVWTAGWDGADTWDAAQAKKAIAGLIAAGYKERGFVETVRPGSDAVLLSSAAFALRPAVVWPPSSWRLDRVHYSPLDACALFVFARAGYAQPVFRTLMGRVYDPGARLDRARVHAENAREVFESGDIDGGLAEAAIAAEAAPGDASSRYVHAAMLSVAGQLKEALAELAEAVKRDAKLKARARGDIDFEPLLKDAKFRELTGK